MQVALASHPPLLVLHELTAVQICPPFVVLYPVLQLQVYQPGELVQVALFASQCDVPSPHSLLSTHIVLLPEASTQPEAQPQVKPDPPVGVQVPCVASHIATPSLQGVVSVQVVPVPM